VIHEAFKGFEVRFFLAIIVTGATEVVVVFPVSRLDVNVSLILMAEQKLLPRRADLEVVWRGSRRCLYGSPK